MPLRIRLSAKAEREIASAFEYLGEQATPLLIAQMTGYSITDVKKACNKRRLSEKKKFTRRSGCAKNTKIVRVNANDTVPQWIEEIEKNTGMTAIRHDSHWILLSPNRVPIVALVGNDKKNILQGIRPSWNLLSIQGITQLEFDRRRNKKTKEKSDK